MNTREYDAVWLIAYHYQSALYSSFRLPLARFIFRSLKLFLICARLSWITRRSSMAAEASLSLLGAVFLFLLLVLKAWITGFCTKKLELSFSMTSQGLQESFSSTSSFCLPVLAELLDSLRTLLLLLLPSLRLLKLSKPKLELAIGSTSFSFRGQMYTTMLSKRVANRHPTTPRGPYIEKLQESLNTSMETMRQRDTITMEQLKPGRKLPEFLEQGLLAMTASKSSRKGRRARASWYLSTRKARQAAVSTFSAMMRGQRRREDSTLKNSSAPPKMPFSTTSPTKQSSKSSTNTHPARKVSISTKLAALQPCSEIAAEMSS